MHVNACVLVSRVNTILRAGEGEWYVAMTDITLLTIDNSAGETQREREKILLNAWNSCGNPHVPALAFSFELI